MAEKARYITTTLPYVNDDPHVGFALEILQADALARYWRLMDEEVFFTTGTDEHGQKISQKAEEAGEDVQVYVDHYAAQFGKLKDILDLSYDNFVRTTSEHHKKAAQEIWKRCANHGYIDKKLYKGLYCVGDEMFLRESDLVDGRCPNHPNMDPIEIEEENYYFKLSKPELRNRLVQYLSNKSVVVPDWQRQWALGLEKVITPDDLSISRPKSRVDWGIPVPGDDEHVMYVWFDALTNYISTLGWPEDSEGNFKKFWEEGETLQLAGKDQVRFQSIIWQAMLMAAEIKPTDRIFYHGFINSGGQKMSKSLGNVISPFELVEKYGTDATRFLLLRHVHPFEDTDITWERLDEWYTADLANGVGNFVARVTKMAEEYEVEHGIPIGEEELLGLGLSLKSQTTEMEKLQRYLYSFEFNKALDLVWEQIEYGDKVIQNEQPFKLIKTDKEKAKRIVADLSQRAFRVGTMLEPFMPETAGKIKEAIRANKKPETLFVRLEN